MSRQWESKWERGERLGKGGQGETYIAAFRDNPEVRGALKCLRNFRNEQARGRMRREVTNLEVLANDGADVPRVLDHNMAIGDEVLSELYVVMDLVDGPTLTDFIAKNGTCPLDTSVALIMSLCKTFLIAHTYPIVHRDLKPDNIIVRDRSSLVVLDFGLSFNVNDDNITKINETFSNKFCDLPETNTPGGNRRDLRSDLTAICAIFYYCLTGHVPGQLQDASGKPPHRRNGFSCREALLDHPSITSLEGFFDRGFAPNIDNRFQTVEELSQKLSEFYQFDNDHDFSDPIRLAQASSAKLRANDRVTQLADFRKHAQELFQYIAKEANNYQGKLGRFSVSNLMTSFGSPANALPVGLEFVQKAPTTLLLQVENHPIQKIRTLVVAARGEQCVLLSADKTLEDRRYRNVEYCESDWEQIVWFTGSPESVFNLVSVAYREWLTQTINELTSKILND